MTCKFRITLPEKGSITLTSPMDWFECHAKILEVMGIKDAGPVTSETQAAKHADKAANSARRHAANSRGSGMRHDLS